MKSLEIILEKFKEELITRNEAVQLIEDLYKNTCSPWYIPASIPSWPQITYEEKYPQYEVTCKHD